MPNWLATVDAPLFVSHRRLAGRRTLPRAATDWALDSGGFTELSMFGEWRTPRSDYVAAVYRYRDEIGRLAWAAPQDWMCEPWIIEKTGLTVVEHQARTTGNYLDLMADAPDLPWVPVLQGWTLADYESHHERYAAAGIDLASLPLVAIGSVCRRQQTEGGREVIERFHAAGLKLHAFGMKVTGLTECAQYLTSSDSLAWSYRARRAGRQRGCTHKSCSNCPRFALAWRARLLRRIAVQQPTLWGAA